jgi:aminomethyltransferase
LVKNIIAIGCTLDTLKKTPLNEIHKKMNAKMTPFSGWEMPLQYTSIIDEHVNTRQKAGLFDVSHMGQIFIEGPQELVLPFLEKLTCNTIGNIKNFQVQYNAIVNENGGIIDDITIYKFSDEKYMICSNASNYETVYNFLEKFNPGIKIKNLSDQYHLLALQGPNAEKIMSNYLSKDLSGIGYYKFSTLLVDSEEIILSRTGYTGEDGFEIYTSNHLGVKIWQDLIEIGKPDGIKPIGLGARDTLRIEARYPLYGHELSNIRTPIESGLSWIVKEKPIKFFNYNRIIHQKKNGCEVELIGIVLEENGVLREHYPIYTKDQIEIGVVTSGTFSPILKKGIGMGLVLNEFFREDEKLLVAIRGEMKTAIVQKGSFVNGSAKKNK